MLKPQYVIQEWEVITLLGQKVLLGKVYGNPKFVEGHAVKTSNILWIDLNAKKCETKNSLYTLGVPANAS
jgi:hypothetical protein